MKITNFQLNSIQAVYRKISKEDESVEVDRLTTIDGSALFPIVDKEVYLSGRRIFLKSK
jgi:hypothetical protein